MAHHQYSNPQLFVSNKEDEVEFDAENDVFNTMKPAIQMQCLYCRKDISVSAKILINESNSCITCFSKLETYPSQYYIIDKLEFPLFDLNWKTCEELKLIEGMERLGYANWTQISKFIGSQKTAQDVKQHYMTFYANQSSFLPKAAVISRRNMTGQIEVSSMESLRTQNNSDFPPIIEQAITKKASIIQSLQKNAPIVKPKTGNPSVKPGVINPADIVGFIPKRGDYEFEYDNDAELLIAEMEFFDQDSEQEKKRKFLILDIYNFKLTQRIKRKQFIKERNLLDMKEQARLEKTRTREEKELHNMMKVFARFNTPEEHEKLVHSIIEEHHMRQRVEELKELKKKGAKTLLDFEEDLLHKKRREDRSRRKDGEGRDINFKRRIRNEFTIERSQKKIIVLSKEEEELSQSLNLTFRQFMLLKECLMKESILENNLLNLQRLSEELKLNREIVESVFSFLKDREKLVLAESCNGHEDMFQ